MNKNFKNKNIKKYLAIIKQIEKVRSKNNKNWMDLYRLAFAVAPDKSVKIIGVEAGGRGIDLGPDAHAAPLTAGSVGVLHGNRTYLMENEDGQIIEGHSISAGLDYPGVGPEHAYLKDIGRAEYVAITDKEALEAFHLLTEVEGIIPALEPSHAIAYAVKLAKQWSSDKTIIINLSGRGDKDMQTIAEVEGLEF